jgi:antitoxin component of MazEF toxin-antitoxin module
MRKKLVQVGNSLALVIDKPILELIGVDATTELEITSDGKQLLLTPVPQKSMPSEEFRRSVEATLQKHHKTFEMLAKPPTIEIKPAP